MLSYKLFVRKLKWINQIRKWFPFSSHFGSYEVVLPKHVSQRRKVPEYIKKPEYWLSGNPSKPPSVPEIKNLEQISKMKSSCKLASEILCSLQNVIKEGVTTEEIDEYVHNKCIEHSAYPSPLNYKAFPKSVCTSVNNVACHGIPDDRRLLSGDMVNVDITVYKDGYHGDCSAMFLVGEVDEEGKRLCEVTQQALYSAISVCKPGERFITIGHVIEDVAKKNGFTVIPCFTGHGIGSYFHGPPDVYHMTEVFYDGVMKPGMTFTIEPVLGQGTCQICILEDGWTAITEDDSRTAQWEHTILITDTAAEILTE